MSILSALIQLVLMNEKLTKRRIELFYFKSYSTANNWEFLLLIWVLVLSFESELSCVQTMSWGAENKQKAVDIIVNKVNRIRQSLSKTVAANFHSDMTSWMSSCLRIRFVINFISKRISLIFLCCIELIPRYGWVGGDSFK